MRRLAFLLALMAGPAFSAGLEIKVAGERVNGTIKIDLLEDLAPLHAAQITALAADGAYDGVVAMYHDQGHAPMKLVAFDTAVNVTLGLPIVRTSVDHGTAFDIAGTGTAKEGNLIYAVRVGARLAIGRKNARVHS